MRKGFLLLSVFSLSCAHRSGSRTHAATQEDTNAEILKMAQTNPHVAAEIERRKEWAARQLPKLNQIKDYRTMTFEMKKAAASLGVSEENLIVYGPAVDSIGAIRYSLRAYTKHLPFDRADRLKATALSEKSRLQGEVKIKHYLLEYTTLEELREELRTTKDPIALFSVAIFPGTR